MKLFLIISILSCITFTSYSQKCKYKDVKKDPFTGLTVVKFTSTLEFLTQQITFIRTGDNFSIEMQIITNGVNDNIINVGDTLYFALEGGTTIKLVVEQQVFPEKLISSSGSDVTTKYTIPFKISIEQMIQLSTNKIVADKINIGAREIRLDLGDLYAKNVKHIAWCILNYSESK